jgi:hypothetical protein
MVPLPRYVGAESVLKKKRPRRSGANREYPSYFNLAVLAALLAATTLLATLATALSGLRGLLTGLLLSAALSTTLAALLAALVLLLIHEGTPWLVRVATDNARARRYVPLPPG